MPVPPPARRARPDLGEIRDPGAPSGFPPLAWILRELRAPPPVDPDTAETALDSLRLRAHTGHRAP